MLVLTRRVGEEVFIGDTIRLKIVSVHGQRIRLGISAPLSVAVARAELLAQDASGTSPRVREESPGRGLKRRVGPGH
jgi:carbon storage regulator CsrA